MSTLTNSVPLAEVLARRLDDIKTQGLSRQLRRIDTPQSRLIEFGGRELLNFSSNDYLGFADHPRVKEAAIRAVERFGAGSGASRLISGSLAPHHELEEALAAFKQTEAALTFSSGCAAAMGTIGALLRKDDVIILDRLVHASVVDAARLSGAKLRVFDHNDLNSLEDILKWAANRASANASVETQILIVTESVFSMDGDLAPLREMVELKEKYGAWLMVDEAHATGLFGERRRGVLEGGGVSQRVEIQMGTLGKALGSAGGYICGARVLIDYLVNRARTFIFSTAPVPAAAAAAQAGVELVQSPEGAQRCEKLWTLVKDCVTRLRAAGWMIGNSQSAIIPLMIGDEARAVAVANALQERGLFIPAIRYPSVGRGEARLRFTLSSAHSMEDVDRVLGALIEIRTLAATK